jgi:arylsulfatase A-like enzyme
MEKLADLGYQTHGVGKMHFSPSLGDWGFTSQDTSEELIEEGVSDDYRNFLDENGFQHVLDPHGLRSELYYQPQPSQLPEKLHHTHWVADRSIDFLENRDPDKPFLLWSSFIKPHPPFESPNPWGRLYRMHEMDEPLLADNGAEHRTFWNKVQNRYKYMDGGNYNRHLARSIKAAYYGTISFIDYNIGRILDALGDEIANTLILFSSDHGELLGDFGCYGKRSMLDPSCRIPMIARLPGVFPANSQCDHPTTLLDLFPTFTALAGNGTDSPSNEGTTLMQAMDSGHEDRIVFSQFSQNELGLYMAASKNWKYIYSAADQKEWLYDLLNDPLEIENVIDEPTCSGQLKTLKHACIERFQLDGYTEPLDGDDWKRFPETRPPAQYTDDGLLFQDPEDLQKEIDSLGKYARSSKFTKDSRFDLLGKLCDVSQPKKKVF